MFLLVWNYQLLFNYLISINKKIKILQMFICVKQCYSYSRVYKYEVYLHNRYRKI